MRPPGADTPVQKKEVCCSFITMVQHLIERCIMFYLDRDDCVKALAKHAGIEPIITMTVWKELEKTNKDFFEDYLSKRSERKSRDFRRILEETRNKLANQSLEEGRGMQRKNHKPYLQMKRHERKQ